MGDREKLAKINTIGGMRGPAWRGEVGADAAHETPGARPAEGSGLTVDPFQKKSGYSPVVGWLVCAEGQRQGECFELRCGRNFIGRPTQGQKHHVELPDESVSRVPHAVVMFDPRSLRFTISAGESDKLCYVNGEAVATSIALEPHAVIEVGEVKLVFVPFCSVEHMTPGFVWNGMGPAA